MRVERLSIDDRHDEAAAEVLVRRLPENADPLEPAAQAFTPCLSVPPTMGMMLARVRSRLSTPGTGPGPFPGSAGDTARRRPAPRHGASPVASFHVAPVLRSGVQRDATALDQPQRQATRLQAVCGLVVELLGLTYASWARFYFRILVPQLDSPVTPSTCRPRQHHVASMLRWRV